MATDPITLAKARRRASLPAWDTASHSSTVPPRCDTCRIRPVPSGSHACAVCRRAIVRSPAERVTTCDRCLGEIAQGVVAGYVEPGLHPIPWVAGTVLCSPCSDRLVRKYLEVR